MKFADCEVTVREKNSGKTFTEIKSLEMFGPYAPEEGEKVFTFNQYVITLKGIKEDFKVLFGVGDAGVTVGGHVYGNTYIINEWVYNQMMKALKECYITF